VQAVDIVTVAAAWHCVVEMCHCAELNVVRCVISLDKTNHLVRSQGFAALVSVYITFS